VASNRRRQPNAEDPARELCQLAGDLDLVALQEAFPRLLEQATEQQQSFTDFALALLRLEVNRREDRRLSRNLRRSGLAGAREGLDDYDFSARPGLEPRVVRELLNCRWLVPGSRHNVVCVGKSGRGKTRVLGALGRAALRAGHSVLYVHTAEMLEHLHSALADGTFRRALRRYLKPDVLICEEFGYGPFDAKATSHLFRVVSKRHEADAPILLAANEGFAKWKTFFPSEAQAVATVDRLIDKAVILRFAGRGWRDPAAVHGDELD
jgi:DNA replication protein DnaC